MLSVFKFTNLIKTRANMTNATLKRVNVSVYNKSYIPILLTVKNVIKRVESVELWRHWNFNNRENSDFLKFLNAYILYIYI